MPCTLKSRKQMAEAGWSPEKIEALELEVQLAREKAKAESYSKRQSLTQQERAMQLAEEEVRRRVHDEWHAELDAAMLEIRALGDAKKLPIH